MPKVSCPTALIREFGGSRVWEHHAQTQTLFCKLCTSHFDYKRKSLLASHVQTAKHKKHVELLNKGEASQQQLLKTVVTRPPFVTDLARMLVACNIPLNNVDKPEFIKFFENHVQKALPSRAILTKCMEEDSKELLRKIKSKLLNKDLVVQVDETTDLQGRSMTAVLVSPLDGQTLERPFLIHVMDVVNNNNVTLQQAVVKALHGLMGDDLDYDRVRLFLTDGAAYCLKAGRGLLALFPNLIHVTCLAHALSRVAEVARTTYPKGTWLEAAFYYAEHFHTIKAFVEVMEDDSQAIVEAKKLFKDPEILPQLAILKGNFPVLVHTITALEGRLPLVKSMELVDELQEKLTLEPFAEKLKTVLKKNPGLDKMRKVAKVLKGSQEDFEGNDPNTTANLANAPMVTCDVERTFSALRDLNTPKRARLSEEHIKDVLIIQWNCKNGHMTWVVGSIDGLCIFATQGENANAHTMQALETDLQRLPKKYYEIERIYSELQDVDAETSVGYEAKMVDINMVFRDTQLKVLTEKLENPTLANVDRKAMADEIGRRSVTIFCSGMQFTGSKAAQAANGQLMSCAGTICLQVTSPRHVPTVVNAIVLEDLKDEILVSWHDLLEMEILWRGLPRERAQTCPDSVVAAITTDCVDAITSVFADVMGDTLDDACGVMKGTAMRIHLQDDVEIRPLKVMTTRELNQVNKRPVHPFPSAQDVMKAIDTSSKVFAKLDAVHGYFQIPLDEASSKLTAFLLPSVRYRYTGGPMGLKSSSDEFYCRTDAALDGLPWLLKLVDDMLIQAPDLNILHERIRE
eukprot:maker-scaffold183_size276960-snap-gene-0.11 protein:Tk01750 transcript:maker-scaffold183_size276960-snap-gene-0.11-mRNA-1 annotation:"PREDICTED: uncharacterized protein LOC100897181"